MVEERAYRNYLEILKRELVPALGCTEPICLAFAAAKSREILGQMPERVLAECVSAFLRGQTADNRYIFLRRYWYGEDIAAIAKRLDCGESRVKSALFRTRKALRAFLEKEGIVV